MVDPKLSRKRAVDYGLPAYFNLQAQMGHTKHLGGVVVTQRLAELCGLGPGMEVLNVGSGSGIAAAYLVEHYGCRVVGVDLLQGMVESAQKWARGKGLNDQMVFHQGDAQDLPFENDSFDALICESVNVFVPDKTKAMREYVRVVKPGGTIAMTEAVWFKEPTEEVAAVIIEATGQPFQPSEVWESLFQDAGLVDLVFETYAMSMRDEARNQSGLLSFGEYLRIMGRAIRFLLTDRENRSLIKYMSSNPGRYFEYMGYGVYVGRLPL
jgi:ubiquinone/menaquinone biosynthesis C-methylase UbiE